MKLFGKNLVLIVCVCLGLFSVINAQGVRYTLLNTTSEKITFRVDFPTYQTTAVDVNGVTMNRLQMQNAYPVLNAGAPELLASAVSFIVPADAQPTAQIVASDFTEIANFELAPSKGRLLRNVNPQSVSFVKGPDYFTDSYLLEDSVKIGETYQLRDYNGVAIQVFPFDYNPVQKKLKVYASMTVTVNLHSTVSVRHPAKVTTAFNNIYESQFLNYQTLRTNPLTETGDILILSPDNFCEAMQPYANWKIKNGYNTEIVSLAVAGSSSSAIKSYITSYYNNHPNLDYVLLVGDNNQFPTISVGGNVSDNYYGEIAGNDKYVDVIIGKISAETVDQVTTQVNKFIQYEQNPLVTSHFSSFLGIASNQGPGDNDEYDYEHIRNINNKLQNFTYTSGYELFEGSQGGLDASGDPTAAQVSAAVNNGVGIINYCGHGNYNCWSSSNFNNTNVNSLTNSDKLPFIISVACLNGDYSGQTCFAEAWLRATNNGQSAGAVGALMSTISQPWESPMCAQDAMIDALTGNNNTERRYTFGGIAFSGIYKMMDNYNDYEVARTWILFGDPAMQVRTATPQQLQLAYESQLPIGTQDLTFTSSVEGAKVVLSYRNQVLSVGYIQNGTLTLNIPDSLSITDTICVLASAFNYIPYEGTFQLVPNNGPYLVCRSIELQDNGNHDGLGDYGETVTMNITFKNVGNQPATNVHTILTAEDSYLTIIDNNLDIQQLGASEEQTFTAAYTFKVAASVPAYHTATLHFVLSYNDDNYQFDKNIVLHAPDLRIGQFYVDDSQSGNSNHRLDLGEEAHLVLDLHNDGNGFAAAGMVYLYSQDQKIQLFRYPQEISSLAVDDSQNLRFRVRVRSSVTTPTIAELRVRYIVGAYDVEKIIPIKIGSLIEDFESGDLTTYNWNTSGSNSWQITTSTPYEGTYAARSASIGNNASSTLSVTRTVAAEDTISFYYKVSSESNYDFLTFYIDNEEQDAWSGNISWRKAAYPVSAGTHTFKWTYSKDYYGSSGQDLAMIDNVEFPLEAVTTGVDEVMEETMSVYPNPTSNFTQLIITEQYIEGKAHYCLYDLSGRLLQQSPIVNTSTSIVLSDYTEGLYLLQVVVEGRAVQTFKIIKQ